MNIKLDSTDRIRLNTSDTFIDVESHKDQLGISVFFYPSMQYIEIRKKGGVCRQFMFKKKGHKKYYDFGYWEDAEVIYSLNEVKH